MPTLRFAHVYHRPWHARVQIDGVRFSLGYYPTREEAKQVEVDFRKEVKQPWCEVDWAKVAKQYLKERESA